MSTKITYATKSPDTKTDLLQKRGIFFDSVHKIQNQFGSYHPDMVMKLIGMYCTSMYGSSLWEYYSDEFQKLTRSWNTVTKMVYKLPYATHTKFIESLCPLPHLGSVLEGRYVGFLESLDQSSKPFLKLLFCSCKYDQSSITGRNLQLLMTTHQKSDLQELISFRNSVMKRRRYQLAEEETWKICSIKELSLAKAGHVSLKFDQDLAQEIMDYLCTS